MAAKPADAVAHNIGAHQRTTDVQLKEMAPFSKMVLSKTVLKGLSESGFVSPTVIQGTAIPVGMSGLDLLVQSKSGTGKTIIFGIILLEAYSKDICMPQALVVTPTRELAVQTTDVLNKIGRFCPGYKAVYLIGGIKVSGDRLNLIAARTVVGTPGRIIHAIQNNTLNPSQIRLLVLDEADRLQSNFRQEVSTIKQFLTGKLQTIACSATFHKNLDQILAKGMRNPLLISTEQKATLLVGIKQYVYDLPEQKTSILEMEAKLDALRNILSRITFKQCLMFASSQSRADSYRNYLEKDGWPCDLISGAQDQQTRLETFQKFRDCKIRILVATDLMSRGIDSEYVNLVINLELPGDVVTYLHRVGRAGRFGTYGLAISFVASAKDRTTFEGIISNVGAGMRALKFPTKVDENGINHNFWNLNLSAEACEKARTLQRAAPVAPLAEVEQVSLLSDSQKGDTNKTEQIVNSYSSIDTKTFRVDSKDSALNLVDVLAGPSKANEKEEPRQSPPPPPTQLTDDSRHSSMQQLPSSNTIDDASSIAADSLRSSQRDISLSQNLPQNIATLTLVESLIDSSQGATAKQPVDLFADYQNEMLNSSVNEQLDAALARTAPAVHEALPIAELEKFKSLVIDEPEQQKAVDKRSNLFSDYVNYNADHDDVPSTSVSQTTTTEEYINHSTFRLSVATPSNARASLEELTNFSPLDMGSSASTSDSQNIARRQLFPSLADNAPCVGPLHYRSQQQRQKLTITVGASIDIAPVPNLAREPQVPQDDDTSSETQSVQEASPSIESSPTEAEPGDGSSGFNESGSGESSGIETSEAETEGDIEEEQQDWEEEDSNVEVENSDSEEANSDAEGNENDDTLTSSTLFETNETVDSQAEAQRDALQRWAAMWQMQVQQLQDYVKMVLYLKQQQAYEPDLVLD